jgi:hypothetical protein
MNQGKATTVALAALVALAIGGGAGYMVGHKSETTSSTTTNTTTNNVVAAPSTVTKAADLRTVLNNLEAEHVDLASATLRDSFDGAPSLAAATAALGKNTDSLSAAIGNVYGDAAGAKFKEIWASHIGFFVDYTTAVKKADKPGTDKAIQNLNGYVDAIAAFLSGANPNLPKEAVASLVTEHVSLMKQAVNKYATGDFAGSYSAQAQAREQITTKIADTLAGAIVKQSPSKFQ